METKQTFGGQWTVEKLNILSQYLDSYSTALKNKNFELMYIDAFAGTGKINIGDDDYSETIDGSARLALRSHGNFSKYIFIEKKKVFANELKAMIHNEFPEKEEKVSVVERDCNDVLNLLCRNTVWDSKRALLFLDPYAADVKWDTLKGIANTHAIDVWYLFPFSAASRMLKKNGNIDAKWRDKLNSIFGDNSWENELYVPNDQLSFFEEEDDSKIKIADKEMLKKYIEKRLGTVFPKVSPNSRILYNKKHSPLFLFCFAVSNASPKAYGLAMRMADYILKN